LKRTLLLLAAVLPLAATAVPRREPKLASKYSPLDGPKSAKPRPTATDGGAAVRRCPGIGSYGLDVLVDDDRMSITVVTPERQEKPLDYWDVVTGKFSHLGAQAEWLLLDKTPVALIVRVVEGGESKAAYLAVAKLTPSDVCVVASVRADKKGANDIARAAGEKAAAAPCLKAGSR
jgi:hypothetical protein